MHEYNTAHTTAASWVHVGGRQGAREMVKMGKMGDFAPPDGGEDLADRARSFAIPAVLVPAANARTTKHARTQHS